MILGISLRSLSEKLPIEGWVLVIIDGILVTFIYNMIFIGLFRKKEEYNYLKNNILRIIRRK